MSKIWCQITRTLLCRLDEVSQLLHEVGHLLCEAGQLLYEVGQQIVADSHHGMWQAGAQEVELQLESIITQPALMCMHE